MRVLIDLMNDPQTTPGVRASCAERVLDRAWGKPPAVAAVAVGVRKLSDLSDAELLAIIAGEPEPALIDVTPEPSTE
jgi:hypothetical protein